MKTKQYQVASYSNKTVTTVEATSAEKAASLVLGVETPIKQMGQGRSYGDAKGRHCTKSVSVFLATETVPLYFTDRQDKAA